MSFLKTISVLTVFCGALIAQAFANDTLDVLTADNRLEISNASGVLMVVTFNSDGTYSTSSGSSGTWTVDDDMLCTVRASDGASSCGSFPDGKTVGDSWTTQDASGADVTVKILPPV